MTARLVRRTALALLGTGVLLLSFVAYQLWGTALYEHSAQARLQQQLKSSLSSSDAPPKTTKANGGTVTSVPPSDVVSEPAPATAAPPVGDPVGLISIPAIDLNDVAIVEGTAEAQLDEGPGHYAGTPLPGEVGNVGIAGHRTTYGAPFYNLSSLQPGDEINVETPQGFFQYQVTSSTVVSPSDTAVLDTSALPELTLTTCNPRYSATSRLVVQALLKTSIVNSSFRPTPPGSSKASTGTATSAAGSMSGSDVTGGVTGAVLWGLGALLAAVGAYYAFTRLAGSRRWLTVVSAGAGLYFLLACFQHVSLALPASF